MEAVGEGLLQDEFLLDTIDARSHSEPPGAEYTMIVGRWRSLMKGWGDAIMFREAALAVSK